MIHYLNGDATLPVGKKDEPKIIAHVCNNIGAWGRGFVLSLTQRYPIAEKSYRNWYQMNEISDCTKIVPFQLGCMQLVRATNDIWIANMIAQHGIKAKDNVEHIRYEALKDCLSELRLQARALLLQLKLDNAVTIHMPRIGCGLAGGTWNKVEVLIKHAIPDIDVYVYDFVTSDARTFSWNK